VAGEELKAVEYTAGTAEFVGHFRRVVEEAAARLLALSDDAAGRGRDGGGWSAKQIVGHLIDSAANNHRRFVLAQLKDDLVFEGYEGEDWVGAQKYDRADWRLLVELWRGYNLHLAHVMSHTPEDVLTRPRAAHSLDRIAWQAVDAARPATLEYLMRDYVGHLKSHLRQIFPERGAEK
jgi:hypothetical protein